MVEQNIQMKKQTDGAWDNLFPISKSELITDEERGITINQIFTNIEKNLDDRGINVLKYSTVKDDKITDNTSAIQTIINGLTLPNTIFIPKNVRWNYSNITHPNELIILDSSRYDARNNFWGAQRKVYAKTESPGTKNANEEVYLAPYHPALVIDNVGGGTEERRASTIYRQDGTSMWRVGKGAYVDDDTFVIAEFPQGSTAFSILHGENKEMGFGGIAIKGISHFFLNSGTGNMTERFQTPVGTSIQNHFFQGTTLIKREVYTPDGEIQHLATDGTRNVTQTNDGVFYGSKKRIVNGLSTNNLTKVDSQTMYTNETLGSVGNIVFNLPLAEKGLVFEFVVVSSPNGINVKPLASDSLRGSTAGTSISSNVTGSKLKVYCVKNGVWEIEKMNGWV